MGSIANQQINEIIATIFVVNNLYFLLIMFATILFAYLIAVILNTFEIVVEESKPILRWIIVFLSLPFLMFIFNVGYGIGYPFLSLPPAWKNALNHSVSIVLIINGMLLIFNVISLFYVIKKLKFRIIRTVQIIYAVCCIGILFLLFYTNLGALIFSFALTVLFFFGSQRLLSIRKPKIIEKPVIPKRLIITHIYPSITESHEKITEAIKLIKEAISEIPGTGDIAQVSASGFTPGAIDLLIKYYIIDSEKLEEIKSEVNLNIIKKLNEKNIKLAAE